MAIRANGRGMGTMRHRKALRDQVMVITGASSGIGLATARMAAQAGVRVVLAARSGDTLARIAREIEGAGGHAVAVAADVGQRADVQAVADRAIAAFGGFDTWVNVAGLTIYGHLSKVSDADHERLLQTNLWGTVYGTLIAADHLRERGGSTHQYRQCRDATSPSPSRACTAPASTRSKDSPTPSAWSSPMKAHRSR